MLFVPLQFTSSVKEFQKPSSFCRGETCLSSLTKRTVQRPHTCNEVQKSLNRQNQGEIQIPQKMYGSVHVNCKYVLRIRKFSYHIPADENRIRQKLYEKSICGTVLQVMFTMTLHFRSAISFCIFFYVIQRFPSVCRKICK